MAAKRTIPSLTGIRGISALWVVLYHMQDLGHAEPRLRWLGSLSLFREGFRGVDLFFVLSGFILMLVHNDDFERLAWAPTARFFEMRFWRVYPLNAAVLVLMLAVFAAVPAFYGLDNISAAGVIQSFLLAQRWFMPDFGAVNGPAWSLSVEVLGYAAFPVLAFALNRVPSRRALLAGAALCLLSLVVASLVLGFAWHNVTGRVTILRMFLAFAAGAALAAFFARRHAAAHGSVRPLGSGLATASFVACVLVCSIPGAAFLAVLPISSLILGLASEEGPVNRLMASGIVVWLGQISFSLYLTNFTVLGLFIWASRGSSAAAGPLAGAAYAGTALAAILAVAAATHVLVEKPLAQVARGVMSNRRGRLLLSNPEIPR